MHATSLFLYEPVKSMHVNDSSADFLECDEIIYQYGSSRANFIGPTQRAVLWHFVTLRKMVLQLFPLL